MLRIDHVFVSRSIEVLDVHAPDGALARIASDHLPLVVDIGFRF
jgi:endonuclease/exonuclease/phosphatase family metal-dependent hydrolase